MFAFTTLVVVSFSVGQGGLSPRVQAALFWIIVFFSAMSSLAGAFVKEEDTGTAQTLRLYASAPVVYAGKLLFNMLLLFLLSLLVTPLYIIFMNITQVNWAILAAVIALEVVGLAGATTIIGAIVAQAGVRGALLAVLSFPVLLPLLVLAINGTTAAFDMSGWTNAIDSIRLLAAYGVIMITASSVLFEFIWNG